MARTRLEQINALLRLIMRRGFGYHTEEAVIALAMLSLGGLCPTSTGDTTYGSVSRLLKPFVKLARALRKHKARALIAMIYFCCAGITIGVPHL